MTIVFVFFVFANWKEINARKESLANCETYLWPNFSNFAVVII